MKIHPQLSSSLSGGSLSVCQSCSDVCWCTMCHLLHTFRASYKLRWTNMNIQDLHSLSASWMMLAVYKAISWLILKPPQPCLSLLFCLSSFVYKPHPDDVHLRKRTDELRCCTLPWLTAQAFRWLQGLEFKIPGWRQWEEKWEPETGMSGKLEANET